MNLFIRWRYLSRIEMLIILVLSLSGIMLRANAFSDNTSQIKYNKPMSTYTINNNDNYISNNDERFRAALYKTPYQTKSHKITMNGNIFKHRVKRKTKATQPKPRTSVQPMDGAHNYSTNIINRSNSQQIHDTLTFRDLQRLLSKRSINNSGDMIVLNISHIDDLQHVRRMDLSSNHLKSFNISSNNTLEWLSISENQMPLFNGQNLTRLKYLDLSCNIIEAAQIHINMLSKLEYVDLSGNELRMLRPNVFDTLAQLTVVNLSHNRLEALYKHVFRNSVNIEQLDVSYNQIAYIENNTFSHLPKLQYLDLSHNFIAATSLRAIQGIPNLIKLSIAFNTRLGNALQGFVSSWSLKELDMSGTGLCEIPNALAQSVQMLNMSNNNFAAVRCGDLDSYPLLQHLDISSCQIAEIEDDALGRLDILITLHLNNNNLSHVPLSLPSSLVRLNLQANRITEIQPAVFAHLVNLEVINLSGNQLTYLPSLPLPRLLVLDVRSSGLKRLSQSITMRSPRLKIVYLDNNPIKCTELQGIAEWATPCRTNDEFNIADGDTEPFTNIQITTRFKQCTCKSNRSTEYSVDLNQCNDKHVALKRLRNETDTRAEHPIGSTTVDTRPPADANTNISTAEQSTDMLVQQSQSNSDEQRKQIDNKTLQLNRDNQPIFATTDAEGVDNSPAEQSIDTAMPTDYYHSTPSPEKPIKRLEFTDDTVINGNLSVSIIGSGNVTHLPADRYPFNETVSNSQPSTKWAESNGSNDTKGLTNETIQRIATNNAIDEIYSNAALNFDAQMPLEAQQNNQIESPLKMAHSELITDNHFESLIASPRTHITASGSAPLQPLTANYSEKIPLASSDSGNIEMNYGQELRYQHPKYINSGRKANKHQINGNINKTISTANGAELHQRKYLAISLFNVEETAGDVASNGSNTNEINEKQLIEGHNRNVKPSNDTFSHNDLRKTTYRQHGGQFTLIEERHLSLNEKLTEYNASNGYQVEKHDLVSNENAAIRKNNVSQIEKMDEIRGWGGSEAANVTIRPSHRFNGSAQSHGNDADIMIANNSSGRTLERENLSSGKEMNKIKVNQLMKMAHTRYGSDKIDARYVNKQIDGAHDGEQMEKINNTLSAAMDTDGKTMPIIGSASPNVSIIDNELQFERHMNVGHPIERNIPVDVGTENGGAHHHDQYYTEDSIGNSMDNSAVYSEPEQWNDERVTSGHSGLFVVIGFGIGVLVALNLIHKYRCTQRYHRHHNESIEQNRQTPNLIGMQMEMPTSTIRYIDIPIDLW